MTMDLSRLASALDVARLPTQSVAVVGTGGSAGLIGNLTRCGVKRFKLFDFDAISSANVARQRHDAVDVGRPKTAALRDALQRINPAVEIECRREDLVGMADADAAELLHGCELLILATDSFRAQARGNRLALRLGIPAIWIGLYESARAGEIIFWHSGIDACFRCLCETRYAAQETATEAAPLDPTSDGCTIFDIELVDAIAGQVALGLLTRGAANRFGRLIEQLGDRNFLQVQLDPTWKVRGISPVRAHLGVPFDNRAFFAWNTIVRADPDGGRLPCPDCEELRGHRFSPTAHGFVRIRPPVA